MTWNNLLLLAKSKTKPLPPKGDSPPLLPSKASLWALGSITPARKTSFCLIQSEHQKQGESPQHSLSSSQDPETTEEVSLPNLAVGGRCLCDDRAGLRRRHGLLNHNAGVVVGHPGVAKLVSPRPRHGPTNCAVHRDILPREDRGGRQNKSMFHSTFKFSEAKIGTL